MNRYFVYTENCGYFNIWTAPGVEADSAEDAIRKIRDDSCCNTVIAAEPWTKVLHDALLGLGRSEFIRNRLENVHGITFVEGYDGKVGSTSPPPAKSKKPGMLPPEAYRLSDQGVDYMAAVRLMCGGDK